MTAASRQYRRIAAQRHWGAAPPAYVDAEPARAHARRLMADGMGWRDIVRLAGVSNGCMTRLLYGHRGAPPSQRVRPDTETRILAVHRNPSPGARIDATGTRRRIQALMTLGWTQAELARRVGVDWLCTSHLQRGTCRVRQSTADAVRAVYDDLWDQPPPAGTWRERAMATRARQWAAARGWVPPAAWDDDWIDDPLAVPQGVRQAGAA